MTCLGVLDRRERGDDNETGLKEGGVIKMSTTVLPLRDARSLRFCIYLPELPINVYTSISEKVMCCCMGLK